MADPSIHAFSGVLADIAEAAGAVAALQVAHAKGGTEAYIPLAETLDDGHWLVQATGLEAATKICDRLGNGHIYIPLGPFSGNRARIWTAIQETLSSGRSSQATASLIGISERTVRRHRRGPSAVRDQRQGKLL